MPSHLYESALHINKQRHAINLPSIKWDGALPLQEVQHWQPLQRRLLVEKLGTYFRREFNYDFLFFYLFHGKFRYGFGFQIATTH